MLQLRATVVLLVLAQSACVGPTSVTLHVSVAPGTDDPERIQLELMADGAVLATRTLPKGTDALELPGTIVVLLPPEERSLTIRGEGLIGGSTDSNGSTMVVVRPHRDTDIDLVLSSDAPGDAGTDANLDAGSTDSVPPDFSTPDAGLMPSIHCPTGGVTLLVTTSDDELDGGPGAQNLFDVGGPGDVSLREAITLANNNAGNKEIRFDPAVFVDSSSLRIMVGTGTAGAVPLPTLTGGNTCIDGAGASVAIDDAALVGMLMDTLLIQSADNIIANLEVVNSGDDGIAVSGIGATGNLIIANAVGILGAVPMGVVDSGVKVIAGASSNTIAGNTCGNALEAGIMIEDNAANNLVVGNYSGLRSDGSPHPNGRGVYLLDAGAGNVIGGALTGEGNVLGFNTGDGIFIENTSGTIVIDNSIGRTPTGTDVGNGGDGISMDGNSTAAILEGNVISNNGGVGIQLNSAQCVGNTFTENLVYDNAGEAIDIGPGNMGILSPIINMAGSGMAMGTSSAPMGSTIEFFSTSSDDAECFHGSTTTDASGDWMASGLGGSCGPMLTATVTDPAGNTSELATPVPIL